MEGEEKMIVSGSVTRTIYIKDTFSIRSFRADKTVELPNGRTTRLFKIKGNYLPSSFLSIKIEGDFDSKPYVGKNGSKSFTFNVEACEEVKIADEENILKYLCTLSGVGPVLAQKIYDKFGDDTFEALDEDVERLLTVDGIGQQRFQVISRDYLSRGKAKELYAYLAPYGLPNRNIERLYRKYGADCLKKLKEHPHALCLQGLLWFDTAEKIAKTNNLDSLSDERVQAVIVEALKIAEGNGHTYLEWRDLIEEAEKMLEVAHRSGFSRRKVAEQIRDNAKFLLGTHLESDNIEGKALIYRQITYKAETEAAEHIKRLASDPTETDYMEDILDAESKLNITLSDEQRSAVQKAMNSSLSIVTGGPGTGKTSFQKVLFDVFRRYSNKEIALAAPTGRAATRMMQASGLPAKTIHQMLHLIVSDEPVQSNPKPIEAGLVVIDEMSMIDIYTANSLFSAIKPGTKVVCVGDAFQLPSVGCGEVLQDLIKSKVVPVTFFTKVFRQQDGSLIAANAAEINKGKKDLEYGAAFEFIERSKSEEILKEALDQYKAALRQYGPDETTILTPYRRKTVTGVNEMNPLLRDICNPLPEKTSRTNKVDGQDLYVGDKVMFVKNTMINDTILSNGDIGYITSISLIDNIQCVKVDFKDGRIVPLVGDELKHLRSAYATTVHKSQGSEYKCCIIIVDPKHSILLKRNLIYTAITRAKEKVILIGDKEALYESIMLLDTGTRKTKLRYRLNH